MRMVCLERTFKTVDTNMRFKKTLVSTHIFVDTMNCASFPFAVLSRVWTQSANTPCKLSRTVSGAAPCPGICCTSFRCSVTATLLDISAVLQQKLESVIDCSSHKHLSSNSEHRFYLYTVCSWYCEYSEIFMLE